MVGSRLLVGSPLVVAGSFAARVGSLETEDRGLQQPLSDTTWPTRLKGVDCVAPSPDMTTPIAPEQKQNLRYKTEL